jgi:hypothetical protein
MDLSCDLTPKEGNCPYYSSNFGGLFWSKKFVLTSFLGVTQAVFASSERLEK